VNIAPPPGARSSTSHAGSAEHQLRTPGSRSTTPHVGADNPEGNDLTRRRGEESSASVLRAGERPIAVASSSYSYSAQRYSSSSLNPMSIRAFRTRRTRTQEIARLSVSREDAKTRRRETGDEMMIQVVPGCRSRAVAFIVRWPTIGFTTKSAKSTKIGRRGRGYVHRLSHYLLRAHQLSIVGRFVLNTESTEGTEDNQGCQGGMKCKGGVCNIAGHCSSYSYSAQRYSYSIARRSLRERGAPSLGARSTAPHAGFAEPQLRTPGRSPGFVSMSSVTAVCIRSRRN